MNNRLIVVLGMHRSGTSAITRGLQVMGVELGDRLMAPIAGVNDKGFWEDVDFNSLNIEMMHTLGSEWDRLVSVAETCTEPLSSQGFFDRAVDLIGRKMRDAPLFGLKDPRLGNLLPFWKAVFRQCELDVCYVLALRNPLSVVESLAKRDGLPAVKSCLLWLRHVLACLEGTAGERRILVDFDLLMESPGHELRRVADFLNLQIDVDQLDEYCRGFLDESLRHTFFSERDLLNDGRCPPSVCEVHSLLLEAASDVRLLDSKALLGGLQASARELQRMAPVLALIDELSIRICHLEQHLANKDATWSARVEQTAEDFRAEIARIAKERDSMLADKDATWSARVEQTAEDFRAEIARIAKERDSMLADKDATWSARVEKTTEDFRAEIARINGECYATLEVKDATWSARVEQTAEDFRAEIIRIATERDVMLAGKDSTLGVVTPKVSVITVNFNGRGFLSGLLQSLAGQTLLPAEIIVVDNASTDGSAEFLAQEFPHVRVIRSERNLGFSGGNNLGVQAATSPLIALINNDTVVSSQWLEHLVGAWTRRTANGERIGAVSPKIRFHQKFLAFRFRSEVFTPGAGDNRALGVAIDLGRTQVDGVAYLKPIPVDGFYGEEHWPENRAVRWTGGEAVLMLPVEERLLPESATLHIEAMSGSGEKMLEVSCGDWFLGTYRVGQKFSQIEVTLPPDHQVMAQWVINNAGSRLDRHGNTGDIGINQPDGGQFDSPADLEAFCGCSVLMRKDLFWSLGGFDARFFMYYEDADLSWRMRRAGYRIVYEPQAIVRHIHAGTSIEWSPLFRYYVTRNYWLNRIKNTSLPLLLLAIAKLWFDILFGIVCTGVRWRGWRLPLSESTPPQIELRARVAAVMKIPGTLFIRYRTFWREEV